jgi:shikimate kinase
VTSVVSIVIAGPPAAGKSTVSTSLARLLGRQVLHLDSGRIRRYAPFGYTEERAEHCYQLGGAAGLLEYETQFEVRALQRCLDREPSTVLDTGGGVLHQLEQTNQQRLDRALMQADLFVLVLPFADNRHRAVLTLVQRLRERAQHDPATADWLDRGGVEVMDTLVTASQRHRPRCSALIDTGHGTIDTSSTLQPEWTARLKCLAEEHL